VLELVFVLLLGRCVMLSVLLACCLCSSCVHTFSIFVGNKEAIPSKYLVECSRDKGLFDLM
jgi:hypothetical protein